MSSVNQSKIIISTEDDEITPTNGTSFSDSHHLRDITSTFCFK